MTGLIKRLFSKKQKNKASTEDHNIAVNRRTLKTKKNLPASFHYDNAQVLKRNQHSISRKNISHNAVKVLYKLNEAGYQAFLVGGGVRDILLGLQPKDFDVATDATPDEVYKLFRNCRLVGRRFRLAHILYGREVIEVATFRAGHEDVEQSEEQNQSSKSNDKTRISNHGMLVRDNVFGTMQDDAFRRDFTVNALYYTVQDFSVIDYTQGLKDLKDKKLRLIGDPVSRYREDPVRMLRAIRLACKLNLTIEQKTVAPIKELASLLSHVASARLWDECNKMLLAGYAEITWQSLCEHHVATYLFAQTIQSLQTVNNKQQDQQSLEFKAFIQAALQSTDKRINNKQPVTPAFLFAVFLWKPLQDTIQQLTAKGIPAYEANQKAAHTVMENQRQDIAIPKRFSTMAKEIWSLQFRLNNRRPKSVNSLINHPRFRAAYDFLCLRAGDDAELQALATWWTDYQEADFDARHELIKNTSHLPTKKRKKKFKKRRPQASTNQP